MTVTHHSRVLASCDQLATFSAFCGELHDPYHEPVSEKSATELLKNHWHCCSNGALLYLFLAHRRDLRDLPRRLVGCDGAAVVAAMMLS